MGPLTLAIPIIAITGSSGKTTTREFIASILENKWKVLKTVDNKNLPLHTKKTVELYDPSYQAILLELGMGKQGAAERHCKYVQPNIAIFTNIGAAHFGSLGNSIESTAKFKSGLIKYMMPNGTVYINSDDENSKLLETGSFKGKIITIGIQNKADYQATDIEFTEKGMSFVVILDNNRENFSIPIFGMHNVYNALFAIALSHQHKFTPAEIKLGLESFKPPIKRFNLIELSNQILLIDDTVNANPQSVKAATDVLVRVYKNKKKIVVLGDMLELGEQSTEAHKEVGRYLAEKKVDTIFTYGNEAGLVKAGALEKGFPTKNFRHFTKRSELHSALTKAVQANSVILVKGSSSMKMNETVEFVRKRFMYTALIDEAIKEICLSSNTLEKVGIKSKTVKLHFGAFTKNFNLKIDNNLALGTIKLPKNLSDVISIPDLPFETYLEGEHLFIGPVIGFLVLPLYYKDPKLQLLRFSNYPNVNGLVFLFKESMINKKNKTITGYYYDPDKKDFVPGIFPLPSVVFNRTPITVKLYKYFKHNMVRYIFNYPYGNSNKLFFWERMSKYPNIKDHLPKTTKYVNINSLIKMLNKFNSVYLKPTRLAGGNGILYIKKVNDGYLLADIFGGQEHLKNIPELAKALKGKLLRNRNYIIQQEIEALFGNKIDFRAYFQKDQEKKWAFSGLETKVAKEGSIISNSKNRKKIVAGKVALKEIYNLDENTIEDKIKEITEICTMVLKIMEKQGRNLGDAAVDLIIDKNTKIWLLEVQVNYAAEIKANRTPDEQEVLPKILPTPFLYAKVLAGF